MIHSIKAFDIYLSPPCFLLISRILSRFSDFISSPYTVLAVQKKIVSLPMIILFVFAETKIIKKADSHNRNQPKFLLFKKFLEDSSNIKK